MLFLEVHTLLDSREPGVRRAQLAGSVDHEAWKRVYLIEEDECKMMLMKQRR
jgi:hypothetical protein